ncbi:nucleoid-associated protein [Vibrio splendidus]
MSTQLQSLVLHQLTKNDDSGELNVAFSPADKTLPVDLAEDLICNVHRIMNSKTVGYCRLIDDSEFKESMIQGLAQPDAFYDFSQNASQRFQEIFSRYPFSEEGTLLFSHYTTLATDYMVIALLPSKPTLQIKENLDLSSTSYLDIEKVTVAMRVDLSMMHTDPESNRYLTIVKNGATKRTVDFFIDFLECEIGLDPKHQSQILMKAVNDFISDSEIDHDTEMSVKKSISTFCNSTVSEGDDFSYRELSDEIGPLKENGTEFSDYIQSNGYELEDAFPVDKPQTDKLLKFKGAGGGVNITFDALLLDERIFYDEETDTLTLKGTPPNIRHSLVEAKKRKRKANAVFGKE